MIAVGKSQEQVSKIFFALASKQTKGVQALTEFETAGGTVEKGITLEAKLLTAGAIFEQAGQEICETNQYEESAEFI